MIVTRRISLILTILIVFGSLFGISNYSYADLGDFEISLFTYTNENNSFGIFDSENERDTYNEIEINEVFFEPDLVSIGDVVNIELPNSTAHTAIIDKVDVDINDVYTVRGRLIDHEYSYFLLSSKDDISTGTINLVDDGDQYLVKYDSETMSHYIEKVIVEDMELVPSDPLMPPVEEIEALDDFVDTNDYSMYNLGEMVTLDLMIVYTPRAMTSAEYEGGIDNIIAQAMASSQLVLDNSDVNINLRLVHSQMIDYRESGDAVLDLERITYKDGYMDEVHTLRDKYGADLVALVGDIEYNGGIGWLLTNKSGDPKYAFTVSSVNVISWSNTLIHEIGHNMGAHHSRNQYSSPAPVQGGIFQYSTGWRWTGLSGQSFASVMTYNEGSQRVPIFSNPDILWDGKPTGSYSGNYAPADNARTLREIKHVISNYSNKKVIDIPVKSITLDRTSLNIFANETESLIATVDPYVSHHELVWSSSNSSVAQVDSKGNVTGLTEGNAIITVTTKNGTKSANCIVTVEEDKEIIFNDLNLENSVRNAISKYYDRIFKSDIKDLDTLDLAYRGIVDLEGLQYFSNLVRLYIDNNQIENITPLMNLKALEYLNISSNKILSIDALRELTNLEFLIAENNLITDIEPLKEVNKLRYGYFANNKIKDISPIKFNNKYSYFDFTNNEIFDISQLVTNSEYFESNSGPKVNLNSNYLDTTMGSQNMMDIETLIFKGYTIYYYSQNQIIGVNEVILNKPSLNLETGQVDSLIATIMPSNATNQDIIWSSSDENVVHVDNKGNVTALSPGMAIITATTVNGYKTATCEVIVNKAYDVWKNLLITESPNHPWTVKFNSPVDISTINNSSAYIVDQDNNRLTFINAVGENDEKFGYIKLINNGEFQLNTIYWIVIEDAIKSTDNRSLNKGIKIEFLVHSHYY